MAEAGASGGTGAGGGVEGVGAALPGSGGGPALLDPGLGALLDAAHADLGRVCAWMEGESLPGGPARLVKRARAGLAAVRAYLDALDEELPPPTPGEHPNPSPAPAARRAA